MSNSGPKVTEVDLIANIAGVGTNPNFIDPNLVNGWGVIVHNNHLWVNANGSDLLIKYSLNGSCPYNISFYDETGTQLTGVAPTGIVLNTTCGYLISDGRKITQSTFLIASESGDLFGYSELIGGGNKAFRIFNGSKIPNRQKPVYKGLAVTCYNLFAVDFLNGLIDVFVDCGNINCIVLSRSIQQYKLLPPNFASPFNIVHLDNLLYVLYANKESADAVDDNGGGFVDVHTMEGCFIRHFIIDNTLDSPWALIKAQGPNWGVNRCANTCVNDIWVGNFKSGKINVYNRCGYRLGTVQATISSSDIIIDGLWGLYPYNGKVYFASGPNDEANGLVGYLRKC